MVSQRFPDGRGLHHFSPPWRSVAGVRSEPALVCCQGSNSSSRVYLYFFWRGRKQRTWSDVIDDIINLVVQCDRSCEVVQRDLELICRV